MWKCPKCGNIWHVNFHKSKFTFDTLKNYETKEWRISQINFTGHVCNETESAAIYEKIENEQMDIYRVDHFECPKCGAQSQTVNTAMLEEMEKRDNRKENGWEIAGVSYDYQYYGMDEEQESGGENGEK